MMLSEQIHRYPRWIVWLIELLCTLSVVLGLIRFGRDLLRYLWFLRGGPDTSFFRRVPFLPDIVAAVRDATANNPIVEYRGLLPALSWLALALLAALILRNALPTIRTSPRGMLIEFVGGWLPVPWEALHAIKVTEDVSATRFVLLAETDRHYLTGWHRFYSFIYRFGLRRGFLITSMISDFQELVKTLLSESDRVARVLENVRPAQLQEEASSPLFRLLLSPASFFSQRTKAEARAEAAAPAAGYVSASVSVAGSSSAALLQGSYPMRIKAIFSWGALGLAVLLILRYIVYWLTFLAVVFESLRSMAPFRGLGTEAQLHAPLWILVAAHLLLIGMLWVLAGLYNLLPEVQLRSDGIGVRYFSRWFVVPWGRITAVKVTELSEESQIVLIQFNGGLPTSSRLSSLLYDGSVAPGLLITSAISNFEPLMQRIVLEVTHSTSPQGAAVDSPVLQAEASSPLLLMSLRAAPTLDYLVEQVRADETTKELRIPALLRASGPMFWLALPIAVLPFLDYAIRQALVPSGGLIMAGVVLFFLSLLEWPLVVLGMILLDDMTGGGEEGNRAFYLYPKIQLPRLLPLAGSLICLLLGIPVVPVLLWIAAIGWSFLLSAGLWEALYDWHGPQLLAGGLVPVGFQLLVLLVYLLIG